MKPRTKAILAAALLIGSGFVVGAGVGAWLSARSILRLMQSSPEEPGIADAVLGHIQSDLSSKLDLDEPTRAALMVELKRGAIEVKRARAVGVEGMRRSLIDSAGRVAAILPPEKREAFYVLARDRFDRSGFGGFFLKPDEQPVKK